MIWAPPMESTKRVLRCTCCFSKRPILGRAISPTPPYIHDPRFSVYNTEYRTLSHLSNGVYFWEYTRSPNVLWVHTKNFRFEAGSPVLRLDPTQVALVGDVTARFQPVPKAPF